MIKTIAIVAAGVIAALIIGGALEVTWHPEELAQVPSRVVTTLASQEQLQRLTSAAQSLLAKLVVTGLPKILPSPTGEVAGSHDQAATPSPAFVQPIPLKF